MAPPKKKVDKTAMPAIANSEETEVAGVKKKRVLKRNVKPKPQLKIPSIVKVKPSRFVVPSENPLPDNTELNSSPRKRRLLTSEAKIQMANEVLQTVLAIKSPVTLPITPKKTKETKNEVKEETPKEPKKRKGRPVRPNKQTKEAKPNKQMQEAEPNTQMQEPDPNTQAQEANFNKQAHEAKPGPKRSKKAVVKDNVEESIEVVPLKKKVVRTPAKKIVNIADAKPTIKPKVAKPTIEPKVVKPRGRKKVLPETPRVTRPRRVQSIKKNDQTNPEAINNIAVEIENNIREEKPIVDTINGDDSRRTSVSSNCLSWTKDISSSSTTTCFTVRSDDFFRIDKKIPMLELTKIQPKQHSDTSTSSSSDSESSSSSSSSTITQTPKNNGIKTPEFNGCSPNLSMSSISKATSIASPKTNDKDQINTFEKALQTLDKVSLVMKNFNLEILNWLGYANDDPITNPKMEYQVKIIDQLKEENDIVKCCLNTNKQNKTKDFDFELNSEKVSSTYTDSKIDGHVGYSEQRSANKSCDNGDDRNSEDKDREEVRHREETRYHEESRYREETDQREKKGYRSEARFRYTQDCIDDDDDDDALSIFAEGSITGAESERPNSSMQIDNPNENDEYIPQPVTNHISPNISYQPSKIQPNLTANTQNYNKQNDSFKLPVSIQIPQLVKRNNVILPDEPKRLNLFMPNSDKPFLMASVYKQKKNQRKIYTLKDVCFFNLLNTCKRENCGFPHTILDDNAVKIRLSRLSEEMFIYDYMQLRTWPILRRMYGMCFVQECSRRELTNILVEMAIDFTMKVNKASPEDEMLKVSVIEVALLHLNKADLSTCADFLNYQLSPSVLLCDEFMKSLAETQNFSRFKIVFIKLTNFIVQNNRTFSLSVAESILERVAILPCEENIARAMIKIMKNTDTQIFQNIMLTQFEASLKSLQPEIYMELQLFKVQLLTPHKILKPPVLEDFDSQLVEKERSTPSDASNPDSVSQKSEEAPPRLPQTFTITNHYATTSTANVSTSPPAKSFTIPMNNSFQPPPARNFTVLTSPPKEDDSFCQNDRFEYRDRSFARPVFGQRNHMRPPLKRRFNQRQIDFGTGAKYQRRF